jgi:hypothetical protein
MDFQKIDGENFKMGGCNRDSKARMLKYELPFMNNDFVEVDLPLVDVAYSIMIQNGKPFIWLNQPSSEGKETRKARVRIFCIWTGKETEQGVSFFLGSCIAGDFVCHYFAKVIPTVRYRAFSDAHEYFYAALKGSDEEWKLKRKSDGALVSGYLLARDGDGIFEITSKNGKIGYFYGWEEAFGCFERADGLPFGCEA